jgi:hypothetical protein
MKQSSLRHQWHQSPNEQTLWSDAGLLFAAWDQVRRSPGKASANTIAGSSWPITPPAITQGIVRESERMVDTRGAARRI